MDNQILYQFSRNQDETVFFTLQEYKERKYLDLRVFYQPKDGDEMRPTKKGLTLPVDLLPELKRGVFACEKKLENSVKLSR